MKSEKSPSDAGPIRAARIRVAFFLAGVVAILVAFGTAYWVIDTTSTLDRVERERDLWQRPSQVIVALNLTDRSVVMDLGSGAGYFALRLSPVVSRGRVFALDVRKVSLFFLSVRALLRGHRNITTIQGRAEDSHVPEGTVDAVLISNTYHEFADPSAVLAQVRRSLREGGTVAVLDHTESAGHNHHHVTRQEVESELVRSGFEIRERNVAFIDAPEQTWWLIVARKSA